MSAIAQRRTAAAAAIMMLLAVLQYVLFAVNPAPAGADHIPDTGPLPDNCEKIEDAQLGGDLTLDPIDGVTVSFSNWVEKDGEPGEYVSVDITVSGLEPGQWVDWQLKWATSTDEDRITADGTYTAEVSGTNAISHVTVCVDGSPEQPGEASVAFDMECDYEKEAMEVFVTSTNAVTYIDVDDSGTFDGDEAIVTGFVKVALPPGTIVEWQSIANDGFEFEGGETTITGEFEVEDCTQKPASVVIETWCDERTQTFEVFVTSTNAVTYIDVNDNGVFEGSEAIITGFVGLDLPPGTVVEWESFANDGASFEGEPTISGEFEVEDCGEPEPGTVLVGVSGSCVTEQDGSATGRLNVTINPDGGATVTVDGGDYTTSTSGIVVDADTTYGWTAVAADGYEIEGASSGSVVIEDCSEDDDDDDDDKPSSRDRSPDVESALGDFVWFDENQNGRQDGGDFEFPVAGATVELLTPDGTVLETQVTGADGLYLFDELDAGNYRVRVCVEGADFTDNNKLGVVDDVDSDVFESNPKDGCGTTGLINLGEGVTDLTWDAGIVIEVLGIQIETTTTTAPTTTTIEPVTVETLPFTGFEVEDMALLGIGVLAAGSVLLLVLGRRDAEPAGETVTGWSND